MIPDRSVREIRTALREWTNSVHAAVMFEVEALVRGIASTRADLRVLEERLADAQASWAGRDEPEQKVLINRLAITALEEHVASCRGTGRLRAPTSAVLAELLPRRSQRDEYFRVPEVDGRVRAGISVSDGELRWYVEDVPGAVGDPRQAPLAKRAFAMLAAIRYPAGQGGEIRDGDGTVLVSFG